jgi:DMSO/TMAO reductase YedYZ molybdopterin-dependent catalytic subunit
MKFPWVNILLLGLVGIQVISGYFGMIEGRETAAWVLWLHGLGAYTLLLLAFFKGAIIWDAWRRKNRWTGRRLGFILLLALLMLTLISGLFWTFYGPIYIGGFSLISLHIYLALPLLLLMLWHSWHLRFIRHVPHATGRRLFLGTTLSILGGFVFWKFSGWGKALAGLPGVARRFTGSYEIGSFTDNFPVVSWISDRPPVVDPANWALQIEGAVEKPIRLSYFELLNTPQRLFTTALDCTGGWYTVQNWRGIRIGDLLSLASPIPEAASVTFESITGYKRRFGLVDTQDYLLALGAQSEDGREYRPLTHGHGFPARLVVPDERGVEWVKWVAKIVVNESEAYWQAPLPLQ